MHLQFFFFEVDTLNSINQSSLLTKEYRIHAYGSFKSTTMIGLALLAPYPEWTLTWFYLYKNLRCSLLWGLTCSRDLHPCGNGILNLTMWYGTHNFVDPNVISSCHMTWSPPSTMVGWLSSHAGSLCSLYRSSKAKLMYSCLRSAADWPK